jgi:hypothetical protein
VWWLLTVIADLRRQRQEDLKFKISRGYVARPCPKQLKKYKEREKLNVSRVQVAHARNPTWEAEIRRMSVRGQPQKTVHETPSPK